jgi:hypothetical protein
MAFKIFLIGDCLLWICSDSGHLEAAPPKCDWLYLVDVIFRIETIVEPPYLCQEDQETLPIMDTKLQSQKGFSSASIQDGNHCDFQASLVIQSSQESPLVTGLWIRSFLLPMHALVCVVDILHTSTIVNSEPNPFVYCFQLNVKNSWNVHSLLLSCHAGSFLPKFYSMNWNKIQSMMTWLIYGLCIIANSTSLEGQL